MAIPIPDQSGTPAGDFVNRQILAEVVLDILVGIAAAMEDAGWNKDALGASNWLSTTGNPSNAQTCTIDGYVYTFKTAIIDANPREVLIDTTWQQTIQNLVHCINDDGIGEGTKYSSATTAHPNVTASYNSSSGYCYVSTNATGPTAAPVTVSESMGSSSWAGSCYGGYRLTTERSTDGHQMCVDLRWQSDGVRVIMGDAFHLPGPGASAEYDGTYWMKLWGYPDQNCIRPAAGRYYRVIASKYSAWVSVPNLVASIATYFMASLVKLPDARMVAPEVSAASGGGGSPVTITQPGHGMVGTGNVYIAGAQGMAIDGLWNVTVVDVDTYTLDGSTGVASGSYVASSARAANLAAGQVAQAYFGQCAVDYGSQYGWRDSLAIYDIANVQRCNQYGWASGGSANGCWRVYYQTALLWFDARYWVQEAPVFMASDQASTNLEGVGFLWGALLIAKKIGLDTQAIDSDGQKWHQFCGQTASEYGLMLAIPATEN